MKIKYFGFEYEKGLTLTASIFDKEGNPIQQNIAMIETGVDTCIYKTDNVLSTLSLSAGIYVTRIQNEEGEFLGYDEVIFNGVREITLLELKFMSELELKQLRDALGIDGDKMVARDGQLQKKSEYPYNSTIDTNDIFNKE
jgi:hypothetical protein